jgi:magnesium chelatase family protein
MLIKVPSATNSGLHTIKVEVEVNVAKRGLPTFGIVGLPSKAVDESKERVKTAIVNSGYHFPQNRIVVNLAPADVPKEGSFYDLPIALGILSATNSIQFPENSLFFGELSLDGSLRHAKGALLLALFAKEKGIDNIFIPKESANEAAVIEGVNVYPVESLKDLVAHFSNAEGFINPCEYKEKDIKIFNDQAEFDMKEVIGQEQGKRAMEIAAAGGHNLFMLGSPGCGKTMLARALPGILPKLAEEEALEVTKIYSASGYMPPEGSIIRIRPFRSPHHTTSRVGLIGGGSRPQAGDVSLAHRGVLFLDEFNEFPRSVLESLRQPMEDGNLTISRSREKVSFPAQFMLVASANPCPCGFLNHPKRACTCTERQVHEYRKRTSGPILDRIDLHVDLPVVDTKKLIQDAKFIKSLESSKDIRARISKARQKQKQRFKKDVIHTNAEMKNSHIKKYCFLSQKVKQLLQQASASFHLSARAYYKMIKVARTIADLDSLDDITTSHMAEALQYRVKG